MTFHNYIFLNSNKSLLDVSGYKEKKLKKEFLNILSSNKNVIVHTYATLGLKTNTNILIWFQAESIDAIQEFLNTLMHTGLGKYLEISYSLFGTSRPTQYSSISKSQNDTNRRGGKYLVIYPFTKDQNWYLLDFEKRKKMMKGHMKIGRKYPQISQILLYSYGLDDNEFIVSYETGDLLSFQSLVMDLRSDQVRAYTLKDTPIFTCIYKSPEQVINFL